MSATNFNINKFLKGTGSSKLVKGRYSRSSCYLQISLFVPVADMTCRHEFCLNYFFCCSAVGVEETRLFEAKVAAME